MTPTITLNELEWRSYSIMADAGQTLGSIAKQSRVALSHYQILRNLRSISKNMRELLNCFHLPEYVSVLETASPEQLSSIIEKMGQVHDKVDQTIIKIRSSKLGYWARVYRPHLENLEAYNRDLDSHRRAFTEREASLILLTKKDQDHIVESLLNPPEPNAALRRAFARK